MRSTPLFLCLIPFFCFGVGYYAAHKCLGKQAVEVPSLVGKTADIAFIMLSEKKLNPRVMKVVDDRDKEPGTILDQIPRACSLARPYQTIFLVISARPSVCIMQDWVGKSEKELRALHAARGIHAIYQSLVHTAPTGTCIGQFPSSGLPIKDDVITYIAKGTCSTYIWPSCIGAPAISVFEAMKKQGIEVAIIGEYADADLHMLTKLRVIDQRPLPGSFVMCEGIHKPSLHVRLGTR